MDLRRVDPASPLLGAASLRVAPPTALRAHQSASSVDLPRSLKSTSDSGIHTPTSSSCVRIGVVGFSWFILPVWPVTRAHREFAPTLVTVERRIWPQGSGAGGGVGSVGADVVATARFLDGPRLLLSGKKHTKPGQHWLTRASHACGTPSSMKQGLSCAMQVLTTARHSSSSDSNSSRDSNSI